MRYIFLSIALLLLVSSAFAEVQVIERSGDQIILRVRTDAYTLREADSFTSLATTGMGYDSEIGAPMLPHIEFKVAVPPNGSIEIQVLESNSLNHLLTNALRPVPNFVEKDGIWVEDYIPDPTLYNRNSRSLVEELALASFRGYHFVPVRINPFRYDGDRSLTVTDNLLLSVRIRGNTSYRSIAEVDPHSDVIMASLVNPESAARWQENTRRNINMIEFSRSDWWIKIETDKDGMYRINRNQLSAFPLNDIDPRSFRLFTTRGIVLPQQSNQPGAEFKEVPILVIGEEDGSFNSGDYLVFYGESRNGNAKNQVIGANHFYNPYSKNTVYWLTFGGDFSGTPLRMTDAPNHDTWDLQTDTFTDTYRLDEERHRRDVHGFDWYMGRFFGNTTADYSYTVNLKDLDPSQDQNLRFEIVQEIINSFETHQVSVYINGNPVPRDTTGNIIFTWPNVSNYGFQRDVTGFTAGTNNITLRLYRTKTLNYFLNYFQIRYARRIIKDAGQFSILSSDALRRVRYDISGDNSSLEAFLVNSANSVQRLTMQGGGSYVVAQGVAGARIQLLKSNEFYSPVSITHVEPIDLTANPRQVDNVIIAPAEFLTQAESLAEIYRQDYSLTSIVVDQQNIFDQFNGGHPDPVAIRQYLRHIYYNWGGNVGEARLSSLTLLGLGTIDWVNTSGLAASRNKVITWQRTSSTNPLSDDWFGFLTNESYPELAIGRYPVRNAAELNTMINNFRNYTQNPKPGWWRNSVVLLADDLYNGPNSPYEDAHTIQVQSAARVLHPSIYSDKVFAWNYPYDEFQNKPGARDRMISSINEGKLAWIYIGHGSYDNLGTEEYFNGATDIGRLTNADMLPFFAAMSCKVSNFDYWAYDSLGEKIVLQNNAGAIASWSATRISFGPQNSEMINILLNRMINQRQYLGQAIMNTKISYTSDPYNESVYVLLGDPHLRTIPPLFYGGISLSLEDRDPTLQARQLVSYEGSFVSPNALSGSAEFKAFDSDYLYSLDAVNVSQSGAPFFRGSVSVTNSDFSGSFIVPDDVTTGSSASLVAYYWDAARKKDFTSYYAPMNLSSQALAVQNTSAPQIELFLSSLDFRPGDTVSESPVLIARISDEHGINITGNAGRNILLVLDGSLQPLSVTQYFSYDLDSHTAGTLFYQLPKLSEGPHTIQLIAFDSFNLPSVASTSFVVKKLGDFNLERFLIYPNPMQNQTSFTFMLSDAADLDVSIYTIRGRRIRRIQTSGRQGFNTVPWDGRDSAGSILANNTYFVKIKATNSSGESVEKTERLVIYK